jgi:hypothetical protein
MAARGSGVAEAEARVAEAEARVAEAEARVAEAETTSSGGGEDEAAAADLRTDGCPFGDPDHAPGVHCTSCHPCFECGAYATHVALFTVQNPIVAVYACLAHKDSAKHAEYEAPLGILDMRPLVGE